MMVSKIAVIALVAIVACPILLGYAMNLDETTVSSYKGSGDPVNVTPLLQEGTEYNYAQADLNSINTKFFLDYQYNQTSPVYPYYKTFTNARTSINLSYWYTPSPIPTSYWSDMANYDVYYIVFDYDATQYDLTLEEYVNGNLNRTIHHLHSVYADYTYNHVYVKYYEVSGGQITGIGFSNHTMPDRLKYVPSTSFPIDGYLVNHEIGVPNKYVDIAAGYYLNRFTDNSPASSDDYTRLSLPDNPRDLLMTMDLNTITDSTHSFNITKKDNDGVTEGLYFYKYTDGSGVHWSVYRDSLHTDLITDLYYDNSKSSNTYQIFIDKNGGQFRYIGDWPMLMGEANYYLNYDFDWTTQSNLKDIIFNGGMSPLMRIDASSYRAFEYQIIEDQTYDPATFKNNPSTTISNPVIYGSSLTFGGNTYTVSEGKITISGHEVPVKDLVLSSVPSDGGYDNMIGNTVISTTVTPSTITFNGKWSASISTQSMESYTYTHTEWIAGSFGWDGVDQNFLMVGLITCLGVFVALGIYARKRGTGGLIPLMIVTGCAAAVFFIML